MHLSNTSITSRRRGIKTGVTAAVVGFPNVGKSSVINSLARSRVCTTSATAGSTKATQEVAIDKAVKLLDSPGVLFGGSGFCFCELQDT